MRVALVNAKVLLDEGFVEDCVVVLEDGRIASIGRGTGSTGSPRTVVAGTGAWDSTSSPRTGAGSPGVESRNAGSGIAISVRGEPVESPTTTYATPVRGEPVESPATTYAVPVQGEPVESHATTSAAPVQGEPVESPATTFDCQGHYLLPGFIDVQVNGGGGALFNADPSVETIAAIARAHRRFGTTSLLPTLISDDRRTISRAIEATRAALAQGVPGVIGVHIEGPCLNEEKKGAHDAAKFRDLDDEDIAILTSLHAGRTLVTLAPEMTQPATIARLAAAGVRVSAGHTNATYAQMQPALAAGVTAFTHLFNAMSPLGSREPGVVGAALSHARSWCGLIVDGHHVDPVVLKLALACKPRDRFLLVTDAMPGVGCDDDHFFLQGRRIEVRDGRCVDEAGVLTGSNLDMAGAVRNAVAMLGVSLEDAVRMASLYPARFLGLDDELGRIAPGYRANLVLADASLHVRGTWIDGVADRGVGSTASP